MKIRVLNEAVLALMLSTAIASASIRKAMRQVASERRRFGYRRIYVMLDRQGIVMNRKKLHRLYRE